MDHGSIDEIDPRKRLPNGDLLLYCSFCGQDQTEVEILIAGPSVFICNHCVDLCNSIIEERRNGTGRERNVAGVEEDEAGRTHSAP